MAEQFNETAGTAIQEAAEQAGQTEQQERPEKEAKSERRFWVHADSKRFSEKPSVAEIARLKQRFALTTAIVDYSSRQIAEALCAGQTIQPGVCPFSEKSRQKGKQGTAADDFERQQIFMVDIDNKKADIPQETPDHIAAALSMHKLKPCFMYWTMSSVPGNPRFRYVLAADEEFTDKEERDRVQRALVELSAQADPDCTNADRMFFGTNNGLIEEYTDFEAVCRKADLIALADLMEPTRINPSRPDGWRQSAGAKSKKGRKIPTGERHTELVKAATALLKRFGTDDGQAHEAYMDLVSQCENPPENPITDDEVNRIWDDACKFYTNTIATDPNYMPPREYEVERDFGDVGKARMGKAGKKDSIAHYVNLSAAYMQTHMYVVGVQRLSKGGRGNDTLYEYQDGVWRAQSESDVKSELAGIVTSQGQTPDPGQLDKAYKVILSTGERRDVEQFNANEDLICFKNGVFRLSDLSRLEHSPDYFFTLQLDANLPETMTVGETPYCDMCLQNFGNRDVQRLLLEIFGGAISNVNMARFKKAVLQYGVGNSGKTQLKRLAERIVGNGNFNNVDLSDLESNRFLAATFQNVRIGGSNDMSNVRVREMKMFKQLTGGDSIQAEHKGEDGFTFQYKGLLWFLANQLPLFGGDKGNHVYERWIVIPCTNEVPPDKQDKDLQEKMFAERDDFCLKALMAFREAVRNNYTFSIPESCRAANEKYKHKNSVVQTFIDECCVPLNRDTAIDDQTTGETWDIFKRWCADGNYYSPTKSEFRRELAQIAGVDEDEVETRTHNGRFYPYVPTPETIEHYKPKDFPPPYYL